MKIKNAKKILNENFQNYSSAPPDIRTKKKLVVSTSVLKTIDLKCFTTSSSYKFNGVLQAWRKIPQHTVRPAPRASKRDS